MSKRLPVWQMVKEAIEKLGGRASYSDIRKCIKNKYSDVNDDTITCQIIICSVNHSSRIHYPQNKKPRIANSRYDFLFNIGRGQVEFYVPEKHGIWEIREDKRGRLTVAQTELDEAPKRETQPEADDESLVFPSMGLAEFGFREVGECTLDGSLKSDVRFRVNELHNERVIYTYTVDGKVKYIGVCDSTTTTLADRMSRYQGMIGAGTNERIAKLIKECLLEGKVVKILALKPDTEIEFKGLKVDLVKGLENPLLRKVRPMWNIRR